MTLVYAKIIGMFVCGAEPGGKGWGVGAGGGAVGGGMKSLQKSILHIYSSLGRVGRCPQVPPLHHTCPFLSKKLDLDTFDPWALDPSPPIFS